MYENLNYIAPVIEKEIADGAIAGANVAVIHKDSIIYENQFGMADMERSIPMRPDTIFRLFSMTKPVTAAAAMILLEQGRMELNDPLKWYLPSFENPTVLDENGSRPAGKDITLRNLLSMTSGIPYPDVIPSGQAMGKLWNRQSKNYLHGEPLFSTTEFAAEMGKIPLAFPPGERWMYGASADIMGAVIEIIAGMPFGEFLKKTIFEPLGMADTGFFIPEENYSRLAQAYHATSKGLKPFEKHHLCLTDYRRPPAFESGGAGLVSTAPDFEKFVKMLMNKGELDGTRILGRKTVELMTRNFLTPEQRTSMWDGLAGYGYGNFMRVLCERTVSGQNGTEGMYGWDGWMGCYFCIDPSEELALLYFIQLAGAGMTRAVRQIQNIIWGAIK